MDGWKERKEGWMDGWMDGWMEGGMDGRMEGRKEGRKKGRKEERKKGRKEGRKEKANHKSRTNRNVKGPFDLSDAKGGGKMVHGCVIRNPPAHVNYLHLDIFLPVAPFP